MQQPRDILKSQFALRQWTLVFMTVMLLFQQNPYTTTFPVSTALTRVKQGRTRAPPPDVQTLPPGPKMPPKLLSHVVLTLKERSGDQ